MRVRLLKSIPGLLKNPLTVSFRYTAWELALVICAKAKRSIWRRRAATFCPARWVNNTGGWYGSPIINKCGRGGKGTPAPEPPANLSELSEKDAMNVLGMMRKEFNVDDKRTYLMGHSMGGAGTLYLGSKYASDWAAIAAMAPAAFRMAAERNHDSLSLSERSFRCSDDRAGRCRTPNSFR